MESLETVETIHLSAKDLICPVCYTRYGLNTYQPISLSCGHNICSHCLKRVRNCPMCRARILDRSSYSKNILIACILEQKEKVKECSIHNRPLEFFCKDHKQLICVECGIEGKHFHHNFIKCKEIDHRAQRIKTLIKKVDTKEEESKKNYKTFLDKERNSLKRRLDEVVDEYIEPLIAIKKKLRKEVDAFIMSQANLYEKENLREKMLKWKKDNESLVNKWESNGEGELAAQIIATETGDMEKRITKYENSVGKLERDAQEKMGLLLQDMKLRMNPIKGHWKKLKKRLNHVVTTSGGKTDPKMEQAYLVQFLEEFGINADWVENANGEHLEVRDNDKAVKLNESDLQYFECTLDKIKLNCAKMELNKFEFVCKLLETILGLADLKFSSQDISDEEISYLGQSLQKMTLLEKLNVSIISDYVNEKNLNALWMSMSCLIKLKILDITVGENNELSNQGLIDFGASLVKMKSLKELSIRFTDCDMIMNEGLSSFIQNIKELTHLSKLKLSVSECKKLNYKWFDAVCNTLPVLTHLQELTLAFEGLYELANPNIIFSLATAISSLPKLKKLDISFAENTYLASYAIRKFLNKISVHLTGLKELSIDFSRCKEVGNQTLESIGASISQLAQLNKLALKFKMCNISDKGVAALSNHLSNLEYLKSLTIDCRHCKLVEENGSPKALEYFAKFNKLTEKELLFTTEKNQGQQHANERHEDALEQYNPMSERRSWSALEDSITFEESEILEIDDDYDDADELGEDYDDNYEDDFNENYELSELDNFELMSVPTSELSFQ